MLPWESNAVLIGVALFGIACLLLVLCGTTNWRRFLGVFAQVCILAAVIRAAWPVENPKTDLGRLADSLGNRYQERFAARLEERLNAIHVDAR